MKLIDADALLTKVSQIDFLTAPNSTKISACEIMEIINKQPTAFHMEKVVERLESLSNAEADYYYAMNNDVIDREDAIDIVKKGGVE